jgi:uncharacterized protein (DUF2147 family)
MKGLKKLSKVVVVAGLFVSLNMYAGVPTDTPVGYWKTVDDLTGKPKSIIKITENQDHSLNGEVIKLFAPAEKIPHIICKACLGENHNQPIVGMVVMSGLKRSDTQWGDGHILDPQNGKTYNCSAKLADNGKKLDVRGYVGLPLLGRSQTWERVDVMSGTG